MQIIAFRTIVAISILIATTGTSCTKKSGEPAGPVAKSSEAASSTPKAPPEFSIRKLPPTAVVPVDSPLHSIPTEVGLEFYALYETLAPTVMYDQKKGSLTVLSRTEPMGFNNLDIKTLPVSDLKKALYRLHTLLCVAVHEYARATHTQRCPEADRVDFDTYYGSFNAKKYYASMDVHIKKRFNGVLSEKQIQALIALGHYKGWEFFSGLASSKHRGVFVTVPDEIHIYTPEHHYVTPLENAEAMFALFSSLVRASEKRKPE